MNLPVSKTTNPTAKEQQLINDGKMMRRVKKNIWEYLMATNVAATKVMKATVHKMNRR